MKNIEVELKFPLRNKNDMISFLNNFGKSSGEEERQKDAYLTPPDRNYLEQKPVREWLRIRETRKGVSLNFKRWHNEKDEKAVSCDEYEINVKDAKILKEIFEKLGFKEIIVVEKKRCAWSYRRVEVAIDSVEGLGDFIELEYKGDFYNITEAEEHLRSILKELKAEVGEQDFKGYPYMMLEKKGHIF